MTNNVMKHTQIHSNNDISIKVFGVGGAGGNAVNNMIDNKLQGVEFYVANTDVQDLKASNVKASNKIQIGPKLTNGLGAGAHYEIGQKAAEESRNGLTQALRGADMVVITAGMGGGTGTGAAPVLAKIAHSRGILTVAVITRPFTLEGLQRSKGAQHGIKELKKYTDTLITIDNNKLMQLNPKVSFVGALKIADNVLRDAVTAVTNLITQQSYINLDFADVTTVMKNQGSALIGIGSASGKDRATVATKRAIESPLLTAHITSAKQVLLNVAGGPNMSLLEAQDASKEISDNTKNNVNIIFGTSIDKSLGNKLRVTVIATGINDKEATQIPDFSKRPQMSREATPKHAIPNMHNILNHRSQNNKMDTTTTSDNKPNNSKDSHEHHTEHKGTHKPNYFKHSRNKISSKKFNQDAEARFQRRFRGARFFDRR